MIKNFLFSSFFFFLVFMLVSGCNAGSSGNRQPLSSDKDTGLVILEPIEWVNTWVEDTGVDSLPRLMLIGDSHVVQYYSYVKKKLQGKFVFGRYAGSKCLGNPYLLKEIKLFLQQYPCDVIVFNNGLHGGINGRAYPDSVYAADIPKVFDIFRKYAPHARIIWVNTTPVREKGHPGTFAPFNAHVIIRNQRAGKYMTKHGIPIVDSYSIGAKHPEYYQPGGVHFNAEGKKAEARGIAETVLKVLTR